MVRESLDTRRNQTYFKYFLIFPVVYFHNFRDSSSFLNKMSRVFREEDPRCSLQIPKENKLLLEVYLVTPF